MVMNEEFLSTASKPMPVDAPPVSSDAADARLSAAAVRLEAKRARDRERQRACRARKRERLDASRVSLESGPCLPTVHATPPLPCAGPDDAQDEERKARIRRQKREYRARQRDQQVADADAVVSRRIERDKKRAFRERHRESCVVKETDRKASYRQRLSHGDPSSSRSSVAGERSCRVGTVQAERSRPGNLAVNDVASDTSYDAADGDRSVCAICGASVSKSLCSIRPVDDDVLALLAEGEIALPATPSGYDRLLFCGAVLEPRGLVASGALRADLNVCTPCGRSLDEGLVPDLALARGFAASANSDRRDNDGDGGFTVAMNLVVDRTNCGVLWREVPFHLLTIESLRIALVAHRVRRPPRAKIDDLRRQAALHRCSSQCRDVTFKLSHTLDELPVDTPESCRARLEKLIDDILVAKFPVLLTAEHRRALIRRWLDRLSDKNFDAVVCAVCGESVYKNLCNVRDFSDDDLSVLGNSKLPPGVFPTGYDPILFGHAVLDARGLVPGNGHRAAGHACKSCCYSLDRGRVPELALANDNYIGLDCIPDEIRRLFESATPVELSVIARYRVKCTIYKFSRKKNSPQYGKSDAKSQRYTHGNSIAFTNNNTQLLNVLPPSADELRETLAVIFVGSVLPAPEELQRMTPLLVRRYVVVRLLQWLKENNPYYSDVVISMDNLNSLIGSADAAVPAAIDVQLVSSEGTELPSSSYVPTDLPDRGEGDPIPVATHGVIGQSIEGMQLRTQKLLALKAWKSGKPAYAIPHGSTPVVEWGNPSLFPCMFPHLFPWGIGGAENQERERPVTLEASVRHLLNLPDLQYQSDNSFMYVAMNIIQKRAVYRATKFRVKRADWLRAYNFLSSAELASCVALHERSKDTSRRLQPENDSEKMVMSIVDQIKMVQLPVPGSQAMKVNMRNEIRSMCHFLGMPTFFFTLNPADIHHPLFCKLAGTKISLDQQVPDGLPTHSERELLVARNPVAGAKFFNSMMHAFIDVVLGDDMPGKLGVFGPLRGFYGTIETQGRGSLHCHMFVWIEGGLPPKILRERLRDDTFQRELFTYLDDTIHTCLPSNTGIVEGDKAKFMFRDPERPHPCTTRCADPDEETFEEDYARDLEQLVYECHYHEHTDTCWKNNSKDDPRDDAHCRMRMDGHVRAETCLDAETESILHRRWHPWINQHNRTITSMTRCNSDCKFIGSGPGAQALIYYATDYITKNNLPTYTVFAAVERVLQAMKEESALEAAKDPDGSEKMSDAEKGRRFLNKACNALMAEMEISGQQCALYLTSPSAFDHYTSHRFRTLYWASFNSYIKKLERLQDSELQRIPDAPAAEESPESAPDGDRDTTDVNVEEDEDEIVFDTANPSKALQVSSQVDDYVHRGLGFRSIPLYWFIATVKKITMADEVQRLGKRSRATARTSPRARFELQHPQSLTHLLCLHEKISVPVVLGPTLPRGDRSDEYEEYCRAMLILFKPWKCLADLKDCTQSWSDAFEHYSFDPPSQRIMANMAALHECKDARDTYSELRRNGVIENDLINEHAAVRSLKQILEKGKSDDGSYDWLSSMPLVAAELHKILNIDGNQASNIQEPMDLILARRAVAQAVNVKVFGGAISPGTSDSGQLATGSTARLHLQQKKAMKQFKFDQRQADECDSDADDCESAHSAAAAEADVVDFDTKRLLFQRAADIRALSYTDVHIPPQHNPLIVKEIADDLHLNKEQACALGLLANHYFYSPEDQFLMLVTGGAGTGKSYVVQAIQKFFRGVHDPRALAKSGPTGCASYLIDAETIHYLLRLHRTSPSVNELCDLQVEWDGVKYLIIDEVSMIGSDLLSRISARLGLITGSDLPFGGLNVIFLGDLRQLPPVLDGRLWGTEKGDTYTRSAAATHAGQRDAHGRGLWTFVDHVVTLTENHRQKLDSQYQLLVGRVGDGRGTIPDVHLLNTRLLNNSRIGVDFVGAPLVTADKYVRDEWNMAAVKRHAGETGQRVHTYAAQDRWKGQPASGEMRDMLLALGTSKTKDRMGRLPLVKGIKVMILHNEVTKAGLVNGAEGILEDITYEVGANGDRVPLCAYVRVPNVDLEFPGCEPGVVPIFPESRSIKLGGKKSKMTFMRTQLPLIPAYAYTDYKVQGRTMGRVILDLASARKHESVYVMLSRASQLSNVAVLRSFKAKQITGGLKLAERREMARLHALSLRTYSRWQRTDLFKVLLASEV